MEREDGIAPPALLNRPSHSQWETPYWDAFNRLSSSRQWTAGGPASIPMSEIQAYFEMFAIEDPEDREEYLHIIQALDSVYLDHAAKQVKK